MQEGAKKVEEGSVAAGAKSQFEALNTEFDAVREKFGVPLPQPAAGGRFGGGGRGRGNVDPANVLAKASGLKGQIMGIWEMPSDAVMRQYNEIQPAVASAITEANAFLAKARSASQSLRGAGITLTVPPDIQ
jgi:hypothetical protein